MLFNLFHNSTKQLADNPVNMDDWPAEWKETQYKVYEGADTVQLRTDFDKEIKNQSLFRLISERKTKRFFKDSPISFDELSTILKFSVSERSAVVSGTDGIYSRMYSSAGARYPLEVYLIINKTISSSKNSQTLDSGLYHYRVAEESLERLDGPDNISLLLENTVHIDWARKAPVIICITGAFDRMMGKYGARGYRFTLQEVGFVHGLFNIICDSLGLTSTPIGAFDDRALEHFIDIDGTTESILSLCVIGKPAHEK